MPTAERPIVLGVGELLWDVFPDGRRPGGAPANVAFQASQLGCHGLVCSRVGIDTAGDDLLAFLSQQYLDTAYVQRDPVHPTGTVTVDLSEAHHPRYTIHEQVAWDFLVPEPQLLDLARRAAAICFGTLAQRHNTARQTIHEVLNFAAASCLTVYDVNLRQRWYDRASVVASLRKAKVVKLNHEEVDVLGDLLEIGTSEPLPFARSLLDRFRVNTVCITRGAEGCLLVDKEGTVDLPGVQVQVADTVGAGDAFTAALIVARLRGWPLAQQAALANEVGAMVAARTGAMPALRAEFADLLKRWFVA